MVCMTTTQPNALGLLTPAELAELLEVSERTLEDWRSPGGPIGPPFIKMGGRIRYRWSSVEDWLAALETNVHAPTSASMDLELVGTE